MLEKIITKLKEIKKLKEFATDNGWSEQIMTTTLSPNVPIDNPITAEKFVRNKFEADEIEAYKTFKLKSAKALLEVANQEFERAKSTLSIDEIVV